MEAFRKKQLDLLSELDEICRRENIPYILTNFTAQFAVIKHSFPPVIAVPTVGMRYRDALRLMAAAGHVDGRSFESALDNRKLARPVIRYCDTGSTLVNFNDCSDFRYKGVCVDIELIRDVPLKKPLERVLVLAEDVCLLNVNLRSSSLFWRIVLAPAILLERPILRMMYRLGRTSLCRISRFPKQSINFPADFLEKTEDVMLGDRALRIPENIDAYMTAELDSSWRSGKIEPSMEDVHTSVIDPRIPYLSVVGQLDVRKVRPRINLVSWFLLRARLKHMRGKIHAYWDILFFTQDRFLMYKQYASQKETICRMYADGQKDSVRLAMQPYIDAIYKNLRTGMTLCFDPELLDIALALIADKKGAAYADKLRSKVRPEHLKPIQIKRFEK